MSFRRFPGISDSIADARLRRAIAAGVVGRFGSDYLIETQGSGKAVVLTPEAAGERVAFAVYRKSEYLQGTAGTAAFQVMVYADGTSGLVIPNGAYPVVIDVYASQFFGEIGVTNGVKFGVLKPSELYFEGDDPPSAPSGAGATLYLEYNNSPGSYEPSYELGVVFTNGHTKVLATDIPQNQNPQAARDYGSSSDIAYTSEIHRATAGGITLTLKSHLLAQSSSPGDVRWVYIHDAGGNAGSSAITIATEGSETINGAASIQLTANYEAVYLYNDGSNWFGWRMTAA